MYLYFRNKNKKTTNTNMAFINVSYTRVIYNFTIKIKVSY